MDDWAKSWRRWAIPRLGLSEVQRIETWRERQRELDERDSQRRQAEAMQRDEEQQRRWEAMRKQWADKADR